MSSTCCNTKLCLVCNLSDRLSIFPIHFLFPITRKSLHGKFTFFLTLSDLLSFFQVGYSDSAKDAGRLAACWAQYESQEKMVKVAEKYGVELTFFHGKGGTVGRGGNPALYRAVLAHPPKTINGKFRVTEQGEMITQNFGSQGKTAFSFFVSIICVKFLFVDNFKSY